MRQRFLKFLCCLVENNITYKDFTCFYETSETCTESRIRISLQLPMTVIGQFSLLITSYWTEEKSP